MYIDIYKLADEASTPTNLLAFAADLAEVRQGLDHDRMQSDGYWTGRADSSTACGFLTLLDELTDGTEPTTAVAKAIHVYNRVGQLNREVEETRHRREKEAYERLMAEEEVTRKVECPYCGAVAGTKCRTVSDKSSVRTESHRDRYRLARKLNETTPEREA